ncbi:hypothetical protein CPB85DRAFT_1260938 [Mucidula mucida]|nr:hypothetical protein CPB85DRAFT_1260938 [Mucidula mucida]
MLTIVNNNGLSPRVLPGKRGEPPIVTPGDVDHIAIVQNWAAFSVNWLAARYPAKIVATDTTVISLLAPEFANCNELNNWAPLPSWNDAQLVFIMKANMRRVTATAMNDFKQNADIKDLGSKLESGTADAAQGETLTAWMAKVDSLDRETRLGAKHVLAEIERAAALVIARERQNVPQQAPSYRAPSTTMPVAAAGGRFSSMGGRFSKQQTQINSNNNVSFHSTAYFGSKSAFPNNNSAMTTCLPALTDDERAFSDVFGMCRTCRTPWQNHRSVDDVCDFPNAEDYEERTLEWCICWSREHPEGLENLRPGKEMNGPLRRPDLVYAKRKYESLGGNNWPQTLPARTTNNLKRPAASSNNTFANSSNRFPVAAVIQRQTMADLQNREFMPYQPDDDYLSESNSDPISPYSPPPHNTCRREL